MIIIFKIFGPGTLVDSFLLRVSTNLSFLYHLESSLKEFDVKVYTSALITAFLNEIFKIRCHFLTRFKCTFRFLKSMKVLDSL